MLPNSDPGSVRDTEAERLGDVERGMKKERFGVLEA